MWTATGIDLSMSRNWTCGRSRSDRHGQDDGRAEVAQRRGHGPEGPGQKPPARGPDRARGLASRGGQRWMLRPPCARTLPRGRTRSVGACSGSRACRDGRVLTDPVARRETNTNYEEQDHARFVQNLARPVPANGRCQGAWTWRVRAWPQARPLRRRTGKGPMLITPRRN